jgi:hypothetical protein
MRRREFIALMGASVTWPVAAMAQEPGRNYRLGGVSPSERNAPWVVAMLDELRGLGFIVGKNLTVEWRSYGGRVDLSPELAAAELVKANLMSFMLAAMLAFARRSRRRRRYRSSGLLRIWSGRDW